MVQSMAESSKKGGRSDGFPIGLRVLAVDDDAVCLKLLQTQLLQCGYKVTATQHAVAALKLLRENKDNYDIVITDIYMPEMDGFKLLEIIGLEMDIPVIMMSVDSERSAVMKGIMHGALDYLVKPVRLEELKIIYKHLCKNSRHDTKEANDHTDTLDRLAKTEDDRSSKLTRMCKVQRKGKEDDSNNSSDEDLSTLKRPRVSWSQDLHTKFLNAVDQLGMSNAQPKKILDAMNVPGLTRENVASHLQKFRKNMKKNGIGMSQQSHGGFRSMRCDGHPPGSVLLSFNERGPYTQSLEAFKVDEYQNHLGKIPSGHAQHSRDGRSHVTRPWTPLPLKYHHTIPQHTSTPHARQMRMQHCGYGSNSLVMEAPCPLSELNSLGYQSLNPRPNMENCSQNPWAGARGPMASSVTQLGYASDQQNLNVLLDSSNSRHSCQESSISADLNAIVPMQHEQHKSGACNGAGLFLGAQNNGEPSDVQSANMEHFKGVSSPVVDHSQERLPMETMFLDNCDSSDDLLTMLMQFQK